MTTAISNRTPELIAAEINNIKAQTRNIVLYNVIEIGRRLVEAKELVPHGQWSGWLEKSVDYSQSTAQNLMRIFNEYGSEQLALLGNNAKSQALGNLTYTQAIILLGLPAGEREKFVTNNDIDNMSTRELQQAIKEKEQALKEKKDLEQKLQDSEKEVQSKTRLYQSFKEANRENIEKAEKLKKELEDTKKKLSEAQASGNDAEIENLNKTLKALDAEVLKLKQENEELEQQLKNKPIEALATIEKIPEDVERELNELREKAQNGEATAKFKVRFDALVKAFSDLLGTLAEMENNTELHDKYKHAISGLIDKMLERL